MTARSVRTAHTFRVGCGRPYLTSRTKLIKDHANLLGFVRDVMQSVPEVARAVNMKHIKMHYYTSGPAWCSRRRAPSRGNRHRSHPHLNTFAIIPASDGPDLKVPHGRGPAENIFFET